MKTDNLGRPVKPKPADKPCPVCGSVRFEDLQTHESCGYEYGSVTVNRGLEACCNCGIVRKKKDIRR